MVTVLLIGLNDEPLTDALMGDKHQLTVRRAAGVDQAIRVLAKSKAPLPELAVLVESRAGPFGEASLLELRKQAPLMRLWRVLGPWCEGEGRSGRPPGGCLASYWHQWEARLAGELELIARGQRPNWALPVTASSDERILASSMQPQQKQCTGKLLICATSAQTAAALEDLCRVAGYDTAVMAGDARLRFEGVTAVIWDTTSRQVADRAMIVRLKRASGGAPLLATVDFPRTDDVERAREAGITAVVSKPFLATDLLWHVGRCAADGAGMLTRTRT